MRKTHHSFLTSDHPTEVIVRLRDVLDAAGVEYGFKDEPCGEMICIKATYPRCEKLFREAYNRTHHQDGFLIRVRRVEECDMWIPASEADNLQDACRKAVHFGSAREPLFDKKYWQVNPFLKDTLGGNNGFKDEAEIEFLDSTPVYVTKEVCAL